jgi:hypothetical protein
LMDLGENKIEEQMRQAAISQQRKVEPFLFEFGVRVDKLQISHRDDSVEINIRYGLIRKIGRKNMTNEIRIRWLSLERDSCRISG